MPISDMTMLPLVKVDQRRWNISCKGVLVGGEDSTSGGTIGDDSGGTIEDT